MSNKNRVRLYSILVAAVLIVSLVYRVTVTSYQRSRSELPELAKDKDVVTVWLKESYYSDSIREIVDKYNVENNENVYIDYHTYGEDYFNMLRISMMTKDKPDIFQFGFYDFLKKDQIFTMNELGIDYAKAPANNMFYYKGKPVGVKVAGNTVKFIWNQDVFKASGLDPDRGPRSWEEVIEYARVIKKKFPQMIPFEFPAANFYELKVSLGETSVNQGDIYTSFWDYKKGEYNYSYSKDMLKSYNQMYKEGLIPRNFNEKNKLAIREDFFYKRTAMAVSTYEDKTYFLTNKYLDFYMGVSSLPKVHGADDENYYFMEDVNCLVANRNEEHKDSIKKVYQWLLDVCLNNEEVDILKFKSENYAVYKEYDNYSNFEYELKDPTATLGFNQSIINNYFYDAIRGTRKIDDAIKGLNSYMKNFTNEVNSIEPKYFENYVDKE